MGTFVWEDKQNEIWLKVMELVRIYTVLKWGQDPTPCSLASRYILKTYGRSSKYRLKCLWEDLTLPSSAKLFLEELIWHVFWPRETSLYTTNIWNEGHHDSWDDGKHNPSGLKRLACAWSMFPCWLPCSFTSLWIFIYDCIFTMPGKV